MEFIVFISGAVIMVIEVVGTRILSPYFGSTTEVFTSIISVIFGFLSIGYWIGGILADKKPFYTFIAHILLISAYSILISFSFSRDILTLLSGTTYDPRIMLLICSIILFGPINILLGMISPYAMRLGTSKFTKMGSTSGKYYALGTIGSIFGTLVAGFILIPLLHTKNIVYLVSVILYILSLISFRNQFSLKKKVIFTFIFIGLSILYFHEKGDLKYLIDFDSKYQHISVLDKRIVNNKKTINGRYLLINRKCCSSGMNLDNPNDLILFYSKYFKLGEYYSPSAKSYLMIGGGGYSFPRYLLSHNPETTIDVVEIDQAMTDIAKKYFTLTDNSRLKTYTQDGRIFLNKNMKKYDVIIIDVFGNNFIPFSLTTEEALLKIKLGLSHKGVIIVNIISAIEGPKNSFFLSILTTYRTLFPETHIFQVEDVDKREIQNVILVAFNGKPVPLQDSTLELANMLKMEISLEHVPDGIVLTDGYAPVESMYFKSYSTLPK